MAEWENQIDIATCFAVIEHVENPLSFLQEVRRLLKKSGKLLISTPNYDDWLLKFIPEIYGQFFFRQAHRWYFNRTSIDCLAKQAGFTVVKHIFRQQYDVSNALYWIRDQKPTGLGKNPLFADFEGTYKTQIEDHGISNFLYTYLEK